MLYFYFSFFRLLVASERVYTKSVPNHFWQGSTAKMAVVRPPTSEKNVRPDYWSRRSIPLSSQKALVDLTIELPIYNRNRTATTAIMTPISRLCLFSFNWMETILTSFSLWLYRCKGNATMLHSPYTGMTNIRKKERIPLLFNSIFVFSAHRRTAATSSAGVSRHCSPLSMFFSVTLPSFISFSPTSATNGMPLALA